MWVYAVRLGEGNKWSKNIMNLLPIRSLSWWHANRGSNGAHLHGQKAHARSGPRRRWEQHIYDYTYKVSDANWLEFPIVRQAARQFAMSIQPKQSAEAGEG